MHQAFTCCFTGHRVIAREELPALSQRLESVLRDLIRKGVTTFLAGGAVGFDTLAAETVLRLKEEFPQTVLILVLPCKGQDENWTQADRARYAALLTRADDILYTAQEYENGCMHKRNRYLVDHSAYCIAYLKYPRGGTLYTVNYAIKKERRICNLAKPPAQNT